MTTHPFRLLLITLLILILHPHHTAAKKNNDDDDEINTIADNNNNDDAPLSPYTGPKTCPSDPSVRGYTNTTTLHIDMIHEAKAISESNLYQNEYLYVLCPNTVFDLGVTIHGNGTMSQDGYPLIPLLSNTTFSCGLNGRKEDNCILRGGHTLVHFFDFLITDYVVFAGLTLERNEGDAVNAAGNIFSSAFFIDCVIENNKGDSAIMIFFDGNTQNRRLITTATDNNDNTHDMDPTLSSIMNKRQSRQKLINHSSLHDMKSTYESFLGDTFVLTNDELSSFIETPVNNNRRLTFSELISDEHRLWFGIPDDIISDGITDFPNDYHDENNNNRRLQGAAPGMSVYLYSSDIIDNMMNVAAVLNVAGLLQVIDSEVSFNQIGLATITNVYGAAILLFSNTHFESNYDRLGPIFIDQYSHLIRNDNSVTGADNRGSNCDIFTEDIGTSVCIDKDHQVPCTGSCCDFGDASCDWWESEAPSEAPSSSIAGGAKDISELEVEIEKKMKEEAKRSERKHGYDEDRSSSNTVVKSSLGDTSSGGGGCDSTCVALSIVLPLTAVLFVIVGYKVVLRNRLPTRSTLTTAGDLGGDVEISGSRVA